MKPIQAVGFVICMGAFSLAIVGLLCDMSTYGIPYVMGFVAGMMGYAGSD